MPSESITPTTELLHKVEVRPADWASFFAGFSRQHRRMLVRIELATPIGRIVEVVEQPLQNVSSDFAGSEGRIYVQVEGDAGDFTYTVDEPVRVWVKPPSEPGDDGIQIVARDGNVITITLRGMARSGEIAA